MEQGIWWRYGVIYQIYPRSFQDSDADGVGDLRGIIHRLDYLAELGITAIWLSPIYPSPMADFGYDVSDYQDIDPMFGTLDDFDQLVSEAHQRGLRVVLDFVPNHTSDQHRWFLESRSSRDNPKRDWYIWHDGKDGQQPPNNWISEFGGSVWEWDELTEQYYLHSFLKEQPDLNWRNPQVIDAITDTMRYWLDRGVDGLRVDVIHLLLKDPLLRDDPPNPAYEEREGSNPWDSLLHIHSAAQPNVKDLVQLLRSVIDEYDDRVLIGEIEYDSSYEEINSFYAEDQGTHLPFNFGLITTQWQASTIREYIDGYEASLPETAWRNYVLGNHDRSRVITRIGREHARVAAMLLLTLRGTPFIYYGEELGMEDIPIPVDRVQDPWEISLPGNGRDPARTPMPWDDSLHAGFSESEPWLPLANDYPHHNVVALTEDNKSILNLYRRLIDLRRRMPALHKGTYRSIDGAFSQSCLVFLREYEDQRLLIALNFSADDQILDLSDLGSGNVLLSTSLEMKPSTTLANLQLCKHEGLILQLSGEPD